MSAEKNKSRTIKPKQLLGTRKPLSKHEANTWNCPLCMEQVDEQDVDFTPCECGYQICRFCWNHIKSVLNNKCPACRKIYEDEPGTKKEIREDKRKDDNQQLKSRGGVALGNVLSHRKHLVDLRVLQPNLVYVIGIPLSLSCYDTSKFPPLPVNGNPVSYLEELLASEEYFGQYGKLIKLVINLKGQHLTNPISRKSEPVDVSKQSKRPVATVSAFLTFEKKEEASEAIKKIDEMVIDRFPLRATYGTTKYCAFFLRGQGCPNLGHCLYLHELGDEMNSYTKESLSARQRDSRLKKEFEKLVTPVEKKDEDYSFPPGLLPAVFSPGVFPFNGASPWKPEPRKDDDKSVSVIGTFTPLETRSKSFFDPLDPSNNVLQPTEPGSRNLGRLTSRFGFANRKDAASESGNINPFLTFSEPRPLNDTNESKYPDDDLDLGTLEKELEDANREKKALEDQLLAVVRRNRAYIYIE